MKKNVMELISEEKIYPIVRNKDAQKAVDIAHALIEGGIKVMEITVENPSLYSAITEISKDAIVCAGGIITQQQAEQALTCGAKLFSSPIYQMNMVKISKNRKSDLIVSEKLDRQINMVILEYAQRSELSKNGYTNRR